MDGIINIYKETGFTSFDVVAKLRGILKQKKDWSYGNVRSRCRRGAACLCRKSDETL